MTHSYALEIRPDEYKYDFFIASLSSDVAASEPLAEYRKNVANAADPVVDQVGDPADALYA